MVLNEHDWDDLLFSIEYGRCIPFLGAGMSAPYLPLAKDLANIWAKEFDYPFKEYYNNLSKVAEFIGTVAQDNNLPKKKFHRLIKNVPSTDFSQYKDSPHNILSKINFPIYITTNYDKFMEEALKSAGRIPSSEYCRWNNNLRHVESEFNESEYKPTINNPLVYHLHGVINELESILLSDSDYIDFIYTLVHEQEYILPRVIISAFAGDSSCLLVIVYKISLFNSYSRLYLGLLILDGHGQFFHLLVQVYLIIILTNVVKKKL